MTADPIAEDPRVGDVHPDGLTGQFLEAADQGVFLIKRGPSGRALEPMRQTCPDTGSTDLGWEPAGGGARLVSWTVAGSGQAAAVLAIGELDEGPWWWARIVDADPAALAAGQRLRIVFRRAAEGAQAIPVYALDTHGG
ncbi:hypothetical protein SLNWT_0022 [Streptomyces albus]|uniref:ChsH2 C-terminal OB-fold domain-containing protein n=1 Tax=Streptomyces albus (strain ATCC 21838 / DSM 41398 / FERM P-419 / JCM 4703 / NBRC 107858) TaxID=1081613 RepID=A0A0B5EEN8_STRA4|nr:hypothetical protein SLNWT_0022 [Streptomyces albus]AOU74713.1 hypothetical protein SLNHY_0022 [Streptomyces albus]AYN30524.1 hypothetical protein DUI70_0021 [Streptomyces albus]